MESDEQEDVLSFLPLSWLRRVNFKDCTDDIVGWQGTVPFSRTAVAQCLFSVKLAQSMCSKPPPPSHSPCLHSLPPYHAILGPAKRNYADLKSKVLGWRDGSVSKGPFCANPGSRV